MNFQKIGAVSAAIAIALGATGAHNLEPQLVADGMYEAWKTAVLYHLIHSVALFFLSTVKTHDLDRATVMALWLWLAGIVLFSGSLYGLALTHWSLLGPLTPLGGLSLIAGWISLLFARK